MILLHGVGNVAPVEEMRNCN